MSGSRSFGMAGLSGMKPRFHRQESVLPSLLHWCLPALLLLAGAGPSFSQEASVTGHTRITQTERTSAVAGPLDIARTNREAWGLDESDWKAYVRLMQGPSGLWYSHLPPAFVLGINATTESERDRFARMVHEQERRRIDALLAFNRAYQRIARDERERPGFSYFDETLLSQAAPASGQSSVQALIDRSLNTGPERIQLFVERDCERCTEAARTFSETGRELDIYYVDAASDLEISRWARNAGIPAGLVRDRTITLSHDHGALARAGHGQSNLPLIFRNSALVKPVSLGSALEDGG